MKVKISGNYQLNKLTNDGRTYTLRVDLTNYDGVSIFAKYHIFSVGPDIDKYRLKVGDYNNNSTTSECLICPDIDKYRLKHSVVQKKPVYKIFDTSDADLSFILASNN